MRRITLNVENHIVGMLLAGHICREIARKQGVTISTVNHFVEDERRRTPDFYEIRRLALKLKKHNMSLYDAYRSAKLLEKLNELGFHFKNSEPT